MSFTTHFFVTAKEVGVYVDQEYVESIVDFKPRANPDIIRILEMAVFDVAESIKVYDYLDVTLPESWVWPAMPGDAELQLTHDAANVWHEGPDLFA